MKIGFCTGVVGKDNQTPDVSRLEAIKRIGYDYAELGVAQVMALSEESFNTVLGALKAIDLPCLCLNGFLPGTIRLTGPEADLDAAQAYAEKAFARVQALGAGVIVFGSGGARNLPGDFPLADGLNQVAAFLAAIADSAQAHHIAIAIEPLNRMESNILNRVSEAVALARRVNHPAIGVLADTYHMNLSYEPMDNIVDAAPWLRHVHVARTLGRRLPAARDGEDYGKVFEALARAGYDRTLSMEAAAQADFEREAADALRLMRSLAG